MRKDPKIWLQSLRAELSVYEAKHELVQHLVQEELKEIEAALDGFHVTGKVAPGFAEIPPLLPADRQTILSYGKVTVPYELIH
ncbi:hypothetical protein [Heyndrickxia coagulans]|uniref:hypothetical protein n=1 Tax=Heyndrickxia coagulans TaxID=1398 RepID=UPI002164663B|nr:hypothetical protein [Heyndrickxia coagulans]